LFWIQNYRGGARASAFTFFSVKIPLITAYFEEKIYRKVEKVKEVEEKKGKKGLENKNFFDFFSFN
jgi:hypothetical protein